MKFMLTQALEQETGGLHGELSGPISSGEAEFEEKSAGFSTKTWLDSSNSEDFWIREEAEVGLKKAAVFPGNFAVTAI